MMYVLKDKLAKTVICSTKETWQTCNV